MGNPPTHPEYSPDLAPLDYHLFRSMQHALMDTYFSSYEKVKKWIASKGTAFYRRGIAFLPERLEKVAENRENYFD